MNLENHGEMFLEHSARMDIPSSDGHLLEWTNPSLDGGWTTWKQNVFGT